MGDDKDADFEWTIVATGEGDIDEWLIDDQDFGLVDRNGVLEPRGVDFIGTDSDGVVFAQSSG